MTHIARLFVFAVLLGAAVSAEARPRILILTDIGGDPDDQQSLVRLLLYSNELDIEGLVASASGTPGELKASSVKPELIRQYVDAYEKVRPTLLRHDVHYPPAARLRSVIKTGNPQRGAANVGEGKDTEGSRWIIRMVDRADPRPLDIAIWGGPTELAQALWKVRKDRSAPALRRFVSKIRVHAIGHQDDSGPWILENFPDLWYILDSVTEVPRKEGGTNPDRRPSTYRGIYLGGDLSFTSAEWMNGHVRERHGPLGALYPPKTWTAPNPHGAVKEGDTPSWFYFLENGLQDPAHPDWGGWGGRFYRRERQLFRDATDTVGAVTHAQATVWRWRPDFQNDFAARMDWCTKPFREANHPPRAVLDRDASRRVLVKQVLPGGSLVVDASRSSDPDGHPLGYRWRVYREAGTYDKELALPEAAGAKLAMTIPADAAGKTIHLVLEVVDRGSPPLKAYRRVVLEVGGAQGKAGPDLFPNPRWATTSDLGAVKTSRERLDTYHAWLKERAGEHWNAVVIKGGYLVFEGRGPRGNVHQKNDVGSIKKPIQGTVLGAALLQGKLESLDEDALSYWKEPYLTPYENDRRISFRQFAQYRDRWNEEAPPGTYRYNNSSAVAAGACIAGLFREVRGPRPVGIGAVVEREVMKRIGAEWDLWYWDLDFSSTPSNPGPRLVVESSAYELAKLGYLWLRRGRWESQRVFSEAYYREALTDWSPDTGDQRFGFHGHYGYWWFVNSRKIWLPDAPEDTFYHIGNGDPKRATTLLVIPSHDLVAVLSMVRLSDDKEWDVIQNSRLPSNEGVRAWAAELVKLHRGD